MGLPNKGDKCTIKIGDFACKVEAIIDQRSGDIAWKTESGNLIDWRTAEVITTESLAPVLPEPAPEPTEVKVEAAPPIEPNNPEAKPAKGATLGIPQEVPKENNAAKLAGKLKKAELSAKAE